MGEIFRAAFSGPRRMCRTVDRAPSAPMIKFAVSCEASAKLAVADVSLVSICRTFLPYCVGVSLHNNCVQTRGSGNLADVNVYPGCQ
jgi:hypothetical protein